MRKKNKKVIFAIILCIIVLAICIIIVNLKVLNENSNSKELSNENTKNNIALTEYVITNEEIPLYHLENSKYIEYGRIGKNVILHIDNIDNDYYKLLDLDEEYYIQSHDLSNYEEDILLNDRYKNYIVYNKNVNTTNNTKFYDENGNLIYNISKSMSLPIIVMKDKEVGVEYNNRILYINLDENSKITDSNNTTEENTKGIGVLNYHFFYDDSDESEKGKCNQDICASLTQFKQHLDYIKENNYFTPTMSELEMYIDGNIQLPKSVAITIDDGWRAELGIKTLTEYKLNATIFVVTSWYNPEDFKTEYVEVHSHSDNMHNAGDCPNGQGGGIQCLKEETILNDLKTSQEKLGGSTVFCYPFYEYNDYSISMLKKAGYTMAFAGESSNSYNMVKVGSDKYKLPRFVVVDYTTMDSFAKYLSGKFYS